MGLTVAYIYTQGMPPILIEALLIMAIFYE
jgi:hypothetical protein